VNPAKGGLRAGAMDDVAPVRDGLFLGGAAAVQDGFHPVERDRGGSFCWSRTRFRIALPGAARFVTLQAGRPDAGAVLRCYAGAAAPSEIPLLGGWATYDIAVPADRAPEVEFRIHPAVSASGDTRELGVMLRRIEAHDDPRRHDLLCRRMANASRNDGEYRAGKTILDSIPPFLRLTLEVRCNIANKEPCVYCSWSWAKEAEKGAPELSCESLRDFGEFLEMATHVNDCSYGEPPLHRQFADIAALLSEERSFSFTSNGQTLGPDIRAALLGRQIQLYVSIDASTAQGYARYRDERFDLVLANLRRLCAEKKAYDDLPLVTVSFIVMQSNKAEIPAFLDRMREVGVDRVYLRALWPEDCLDEKVHRRDGFTFDYDSELIEIAELRRIGEATIRRAAEIDLWTMVEWDNFAADQASEVAGGAPLCSEPWKAIYALNRGVMPCCFGRKPLARWSERGGRSIPLFLRDVFNGPAFQTLRRDLAAGRLSGYCLETPNCPIVRRARRL
jgi:MoaA/NifB/PqqE/SkfB family radical SAM enzyme